MWKVPYFFTPYYNILLWDKYGTTKYQIEPDVYLNMFIIEFYWCLETLLPWHKPWLLQYPSFHPTLTHQRSHTKLLLWDQALLQNSEWVTTLLSPHTTSSISRHYLAPQLNLHIWILKIIKVYDIGQVTVLGAVHVYSFLMTK